MNFTKVLAIPKGTKIGTTYTVNGPGRSRGEAALVYLIPNKQGGNPYKKRIRKSEWESAYPHLFVHGDFALHDFRKTMPDAAKDGECNFHFTKGVFRRLRSRRPENADDSKLGKPPSRD